MKPNAILLGTMLLTAMTLGVMPTAAADPSLSPDEDCTISGGATVCHASCSGGADLVAEGSGAGILVFTCGAGVAVCIMLLDLAGRGVGGCSVSVGGWAAHDDERGLCVGIGLFSGSCYASY